MSAHLFTLALIFVTSFARAKPTFDSNRVLHRTVVAGPNTRAPMNFEFTIQNDRSLWVRRQPQATAPRMIKIAPYVAQEFFTLNGQTYLTVSEPGAPESKFIVRLTPKYGLQLSGRGPWPRYLPDGLTWTYAALAGVASESHPAMSMMFLTTTGLAYLMQLWAINGAYLQTREFDVARSVEELERLKVDGVLHDWFLGETSDVSLRSETGNEPFLLGELQKLDDCESLMGGYAAFP